MNGNFALLLSIKWSYASLIFDGSKRFELRRTRPRVLPGAPVWVYAPSPHKMMVGGFTVQQVIAKPPTKLWRLVGAESGISKSEFMDYFEGASTAYAIEVENVWQLESPISLDILRRRMPLFHPPQVFRYLSPYQQRQLMPEVQEEASKNQTFLLAG